MVSYYEQVKRLNGKVFKSKEKVRKIWAKVPIEQKVRELISMQKVLIQIYPKYKNILPWRI